MVEDVALGERVVCLKLLLMCRGDGSRVLAKDQSSTDIELFFSVRAWMEGVSEKEEP